MSHVVYDKKHGVLKWGDEIVPYKEPGEPGMIKAKTDTCKEIAKIVERNWPEYKPKSGDQRVNKHTGSIEVFNGTDWLEFSIATPTHGRGVIDPTKVVFTSLSPLNPCGEIPLKPPGHSDLDEKYIGAKARMTFKRMIRLEKENARLRETVEHLDRTSCDLSARLSAAEKRHATMLDCLNDLVKHVERLDATKLTKPSASKELQAAEAYIDDYNEAKRACAKRAWARKKRVEAKLLRLEKSIKEKPPATRSKVRWAIATAISSGLLLLLL